MYININCSPIRSHIQTNHTNKSNTVDALTTKDILEIGTLLSKIYYADQALRAILQNVV